MSDTTNNNGWTSCELGDAITLQRGHDLPQKKRIDGEVPIVSSSGITGFHNEAKAEGPGVVTGRYGTLGDVFFVTEDYWPLNTTLYVKDFKDNDAQFVAYFLETLNLERYNGAGAVPGLNRNHLHKLRIRFPFDTDLQKRIVERLSLLDSLVDNNRRRIALLEDAAMQLYKEWFVQLRFPGHETATIADGVPEGWCVSPVECWLNSHIGGGWGEDGPTSEHSEPGFVIRGTDLPHVAIGNTLNVPFRFHKPSNIASRTLADGDLIFEVSGGSKGQSVGRTLLISQDLIDGFPESVICASFCKKIRPKSRSRSEYLDLHFKFIRDVGVMDVFATQSASNITNFKFAAFIEQHDILCPEDTILLRFNEIVVKLYRQIRLLGRQNLTLSEARDLLLPRLMSGEIEV